MLKTLIGYGLLYLGSNAGEVRVDQHPGLVAIISFIEPGKVKIK